MLVVGRHWQLGVQVQQLVFPVVGSRLLVVLAKKFLQPSAVERLFVLGPLSLRPALLGFLQLRQQDTG